jgi:hypothetical protein
MKRFLAIYLGSSESPALREWNAMLEADRNERHRLCVEARASLLPFGFVRIDTYRHRGRCKDSLRLPNRRRSTLTEHAHEVFSFN